MLAKKNFTGLQSWFIKLARLSELSSKFQMWMPWQPWLKTDIQKAAKRWVLLGLKPRKQQGKLVKERVFLTPPPLEMSEETPVRSIAMSTHPARTFLHIHSSSGHCICQHRQHHPLWDIQKTRGGKITNFLNVDQKTQSGDNKKGAHSRW